MTNAVDLAKLRDALLDKPLLGFETRSEASEGLQKINAAKIGTKPASPSPAARS